VRVNAPRLIFTISGRVYRSFGASLTFPVRQIGIEKGKSVRRYLSETGDGEPRTTMLEYGLTAALVAVVVAALLQIAGLRF
jgi:Flp pilus assembly pilin Flp